ncbi:YheU family protein [Vibrio crassostreae]|uniref:YheU family protein n=1 Tax=Vibrio crassostreae TaxID=246167 RepID=UPI001B3033F5|nr:YheU family protein [Vibrio crassostreae]
MLIIDQNQCSQEAIEGLVHQFVMTSMGNEFDEEPLETKVKKTLDALERGELKIVFSEVHEEALLMHSDEIKKKMIPVA